MICKELQNILKENSGKTDSIYEEISYKLLYIITTVPLKWTNRSLN